MTLSRKQLSLIHVAKAKLALTDDDYREILRQEASVESSRDLDSDGFNAVMARFEVLGFKSSARSSSLGDRVGMASDAQIAYIRDLWRDYTDGAGTDRSLGKWLMRTIKVSDIRFVTYGAAGKAITALLAMNARKRDAA